MSTIEERRDQRFYSTTIAILKDIQSRALALPQDQRYPAAYGLLRGYMDALITNFAIAFTEEQLGEIRIVLDQLARLTGEDEQLSEQARAQRDALAQALIESANQP